MTFSELLVWQWNDYPEKHRNRINLLIHIVAVPVFVLAAAGFVLSLLSFSIVDAFVNVLFMAASLFAQARGHALEEAPPAPFTSGKDAIRRLVAEQFVTFWKFVGSGAWFANLRAGGW